MAKSNRLFSESLLTIRVISATSMLLMRSTITIKPLKNRSWRVASCVTYGHDRLSPASVSVPQRAFLVSSTPGKIHARLTATCPALNWLGGVMYDIDNEVTGWVRAFIHQTLEGRHLKQRSIGAPLLVSSASALPGSSYDDSFLGSVLAVLLYAGALPFPGCWRAVGSVGTAG